jgi:hydrogenase maturation protease
VTILVVGYGSDLRRDDAVGRRVADAVADRCLPDVHVLSLHQLTPEVAADVAGKAAVVFVDADVQASEVSVRRLRRGPVDTVTTHHVSPGALLELAALLGAVPDHAHVVSVPAVDLRIGTGLSAVAAAGVQDATDLVVELCEAC